MSMTNAEIVDRESETVELRLRRVIALHFDPQCGTPFWLDRAADLGIDPLSRVRTLGDLECFGDMSPDDLRRRPLEDYIPRRWHHRMDRFIVGQTGGTTGTGTWTAYRNDEFDEAFVTPFVASAGHVGFPAREKWLYVGPTGPHIIGKVVRHLANALGSPDPFSVDFDPRWAKKLPNDSFAHERYVQHVIDQAMAIVRTQPIGVLFTTPVVLEAMRVAMSEAQRDRIRGVHYGGMAVTGEQMRRFQEEYFPNAVHLSGYGNTLFGCCLELETIAGRQLEYYPFGTRLHFEVVDDNGVVLGPSRTGRVRFTRLDESMLIVRMLERDQAKLIDPPTGAPDGFACAGVRNPRPLTEDSVADVAGLY